jgi:hypothetical protein
MFAIAIAEEGEEGLGDWGFEMILFARRRSALIFLLPLFARRN